MSLNIVLASVEVLQASPLGGMISIIKGAPENVSAALEWLTNHHVEVEVLKRG